ncbi:hypothetical protein A5787_21555 [Mycobacterium sp. 852002-50816_SCH5313054-b]|uniref:hypothetical protein n=1 Tax=Mycobacterium sp. 852002-50816_SCH5313054-b TaxID=1834092 RepID=UPI0007FF35B2|nr:hypothetical protein [Mycobacterium sp. 852002-50816_SCH5313054-b]OBF59356.1 hypothetical protein A5787_21555 [Mycobacterium sp. 852002-50816_SCH5313054-b]
MIVNRPIVETLLHRYERELGAQLRTYRNHVYRGIHYHQQLLGGPIPEFAVLAWAAHDLGIWTAGTFDYLEPSADLAAAHAEEFGIGNVDAVRTLILEHHRLRPSHDHLAETFRIADRIDVSRGVLRDGIGRRDIRSVVAELPYCGFHAFLAKGLTRYAVGHPLRPFPMLRW